MTNEDVATFVVALFPLILFIAELSPWITVIGGTASLVWIARQIYMSFRKERRAAEKHGKEQTLLDLQIRTAKRALGEDEDEDKPTPKD